MNAYPPGAIQPPGPPPAGYNPANYRPAAIQSTPGYRPQPAPAKGAGPTASKSKGSTKSTSVAKNGYRPSTGGSTAGKSKSTPAATTLESRVGKLESSTHRQDLRLGRLERDVGLLPSSIEGGGVADVVAPTGKTHIVRPGDTLFSIASRYSTSVGELRSLNRLTDETLDIGETLLIPDGRTWSDKPTNSTVIHVVSGEESMAAIARGYGVTEDAIARANPTAYSSDLRNGERLIIPNPKRMPTSAPRGSSSQQGSSTVVTSSVTHVVKKGEMLGRIASKHGITLSKLMSANGIKNADKIVIGQKLVIPGRKTTRTVSEPVIARHEEQDTTPLPHLRLAEAERETADPLPPITRPAPPAVPALQPITKTAAAEPVTQRGIVSYRAQRGDTIESVASHFSTTAGNIRAMNPSLADKSLKEGDEIFVPTVGAVSVN